MKNLTTFVADKEIEICYANAITSGYGYGYKIITVELYYNGEYQKFTGMTNNMPSYDAAIELDDADKYHALYEIIETQIIDEVAEWLENL